jgi:hypothetical protein
LYPLVEVIVRFVHGGCRWLDFETCTRLLRNRGTRDRIGWNWVSPSIALVDALEVTVIRSGLIPAAGVAFAQCFPAFGSGREQLLGGLKEDAQFKRLRHDRISAHDARGFNAAGRFGEENRADHRLERDPLG